MAVATTSASSIVGPLLSGLGHFPQGVLHRPGEIAEGRRLRATVAAANQVNHAAQQPLSGFGVEADPCGLLNPALNEAKISRGQGQRDPGGTGQLDRKPRQPRSRPFTAWEISETQEISV